MSYENGYTYQVFPTLILPTMHGTINFRYPVSTFAILLAFSQKGHKTDSLH